MTVKKIIDITKGISSIRHAVLNRFKIDMEIQKIVMRDMEISKNVHATLETFQPGPTIMTSQRERTRLRTVKR